MDKRQEFHQGKKGQISIMLGLMIATFILLFAFVVNTGMLVNAKINLQNAADLAAYAGASTQARQLTHISYLNYEMRRQWKKLLFRLYVLGNLGLPSFPRGPSSGKMTYQPNSPGTGQAVDYTVPVTCILFNPNDNFCQVVSLQSIKIPSSNNPLASLDSITAVAISRLKQIETIRQANCVGIGITNKLLNYFWIYNVDPDLSTLQSNDLSGDQLRAITMVRSLAQGLGIVPRETILSFRIKTLQSYVNAPPQPAVGIAKAQSLAGGADPASVERTLQAFYSAYYTLGNHTFDSDNIFIDEILPGNASSAELLKLVPLKQTFDTWALDLALSGSGDCIANIVPVTLQTPPLVVGYYKDPQIMTYYAVRLKATAHLLFSPFGDVELKAYAAAQPFGSRIGPKLSETDPFSHDGAANQPSGPGTDFMTNAVKKVPNLPVTQKEGLKPTSETGWNTKQMVGEAYQGMQLGGLPNPVVDPSTASQGMLYAMQPNPAEATFYNMMSDPNFDPFVQNFDGGDPSKAVLWAPIFPPGTSQDEISNAIQEAISGATAEKGDLGSKGLSGIQASLSTGLKSYLAQLQNGSGEDGEGFRTAVLRNPFPSSSSQKSSNPDLFIQKEDATLLKTSWNNVLDKSLRDLGRNGYSVKFVSFHSLLSATSKTDGQSNWSNVITNGADQEAQSDIPYLKH